MKNLTTIFAFLVFAFGLFSCASDNANSTTEVDATSDLTLDKNIINFGTDYNPQSLTISVPTTNHRWTVAKQHNSDWLNLEVTAGNGSKTLSISIDPSKLSGNTVFDTLVVKVYKITRSTKEQGKGIESVETGTNQVIVTAQGNLQQVAQNLMAYMSVQLLPIDTTASFLGTFEVKTTTVTTRTSLAAFYSNPSFFANAGNSLTLHAKTQSATSWDIAMGQKTESYTNAQGNSATAYYYTPDNAIAATTKMDFDGTAQHKFTVPGGSGISAFTDSILSVSMPSWTSAQSSVSTNANLTVNWSATSASDDSVFVVIYAKNDSTVRATVQIVSDNVGTTSISSTVLQRMKKAGNDGVLWLVRFRSKRVNGRVLTSQSQQQYGFTLY